VSFIALKVTHPSGAVRYYADLADVFAAIDMPGHDRERIRWWYGTMISAYENDRLRIERLTAAQMIVALNAAESVGNAAKALYLAVDDRDAEATEQAKQALWEATKR
jgi:hypothetical protein